tara:strand:+ start:1613 stop:2722 length:1110 start_codon:yes stop_codon:yes gene_type:complete
MYELIANNLKWTATSVAALAALGVFWKKVWLFFKDCHEKRKKQKDLPDKIERLSNSVEQVIVRLGPNGGSGLLDKVDFLLADRNQQREIVSYPAFECDEKGRNTLVSDAYRILVGNLKERELDGREWLNVLVEEDRKSHLKDFLEAVKSKRTFSTTSRFQNPSTKEYRGSWHVTAKRLPVGANSIYSARFWPDDNVAKAIAQRHGWDMGRVGYEDETDEMSMILSKQELLIGDGKSIAFPLGDPSSDNVICVPIGEDKTEVMPRCFMWLAKRTDKETTFFLSCVGGVTFPLHIHPFDEEVEVISGRMLNIVTGEEYSSEGKNTWVIPEGEVHGATMYNAILSIKINGKLPLATTENIKTEHIRAMIENV